MPESKSIRVGICRISFAFIKRQADQSAPLVSQVLFGERVLILRMKNKSWYKVRCLWDHVEGWVDPKQFWIIDAFNGANDTCSSFALEHFNGITSEEATIPIMLGSNLYNSDGINVKMPVGRFSYTGQIIDLRQTPISEKLLINIARRFMHTPYLEGGRSLAGTDSSGFIQVVFKMLGHAIPRRTEQIADLGEDIGFFAEARAGDLAFFGPDVRNLNHMGMIIDDGFVLHAHGRVKQDRIDQQGIYDLESKRYTFKLRSIRRLSL